LAQERALFNMYIGCANEKNGLSMKEKVFAFAKKEWYSVVAESYYSTPRNNQTYTPKSNELMLIGALFDWFIIYNFVNEWH
jgi:hypothetical protein